MERKQSLYKEGKTLLNNTDVMEEERSISRQASSALSSQGTAKHLLMLMGKENMAFDSLYLNLLFTKLQHLHRFHSIIKLRDSHSFKQPFITTYAGATILSL